MDTLRTKDVRETHKLVCMHIAAIRKIKNLHDCTIVLCLECVPRSVTQHAVCIPIESCVVLRDRSNLAFEAQHSKRMQLVCAP